MRIIIPPVLVADRIVRVVAPVADLLEVDEWRGEWWEPSGVTITEASLAAPVSTALLRARGILVSDSETTPLASHREIQEWLRATAPAPRTIGEMDARTPSSSVETRREYLGNARLHRGRVNRTTG